MRLAYAIALGCLSLLSNLEIMRGQWTKTDGPAGAGISCFCMTEGYVFAGAQSTGVFRSADDGATWVAVTSGLPSNDYVWALSVKGSDLFAGTSMGLFVSTNYGESWTPKQRIGSSNIVSGLATNDTTLYAGLYDGGIFRSTDSGEAWQVVDTTLSRSGVRTITVRGVNIFVGTSGAGVVLSTNGGESWHSSNDGLFALDVRTFAMNATQIFAGTGDQGVFVSTNDGTHWTVARAGLPNFKVWALAVSGPNLFAGTYGAGVYVSADSGTSWSSASTGLNDGLMYALCARGTHLIAGTAYAGAYVSTDNGASWQLSVSGMRKIGINELAASRSNLFAASNRGIFRSSDLGWKWTYLKCPSPMKTFDAVTVFKDRIVLGGAGIFLSTDEGENWTNGIGDFPDMFTVKVFASTDTKLYAGGAGTFCSTDSGSTWKAIGQSPGSYVYALAISGANLFASFYSKIFYWHDSLGVWIERDSGLSGATIYALAVNSPFVFAATSKGIYRTSNNGEVWIPANLGLTNQNAWAFFAKGDNLFVGTDDGVFKSTNNGALWIAYNSGLTNVRVSDFKLRADTLLVTGKNLITGWDGVWFRPLSEMITHLPISIDDVPFSLHLEQNYPNPFNPSTTIIFSIPTETNVSLEIFDLLGRGIATLVHNRLKAGTYKYVFDGSRYSSGVYLCQLKAGESVRTRKIVLQR